MDSLMRYRAEFIHCNRVDSNNMRHNMKGKKQLCKLQQSCDDNNILNMFNTYYRE